MNRQIWNFFEMAGKFAVSKDDNRAFLIGSAAVRKDGVMVFATNSVSQEPNRQAHAEYRISAKIDRGSTVYVARIRLLNGEFAMARPCVDCQKILKSKRVKRVYYTISHNEYGVLDF
jgi:tRNA(Arg) A34 adenosine deaminase TadA